MRNLSDTRDLQKRFSAIAVGLLGCVLTFSNGMAAGQKIALTRKEAHRPAGMYKMISEMDKAVCRSILASLNKKVDLPVDESHPNIADDLLLGSNLQVPWQRKLIGPTGNLDYAAIDLANEGHIAAVYRYSLMLQYVRSEDDLYVVDLPSDIWSDLPQRTTTTEEDLKAYELISKLARQSSLKVYEPNLGLNHSVFQLLESSDPSLAGDHLNVNVLSVLGRSILIITGANESNGGLNGRPFNVFAVSYHSKAAPSLVCKFRGGN